MDAEIFARNVDGATSIEQSTNIQGQVRQIIVKIVELRRLLSYVCAASGKMTMG